MISERRATGRSHRLLALAGALAALLAQTGSVAADNESWTVTASPQTIVAGSSGKVRLTIKNTSGDNNDIACVEVTIPAVFTIGTPSIVSVTNGLDWSASRSTRSGKTVVTAVGANGEWLATDDTLVVDVPAGATLAAGAWKVRAYDQTDCNNQVAHTYTFQITVLVSQPTPSPTPKPTPKPTPTPNPTAAATPRPTAVPTATPTRSPGPTARPTDRPSADPSASAEPSPSSSPAASARPTATPAIGLGGPPAPPAPPTDGSHFEGVISIPVDEADPTFSGLGMDLLVSLGVFAWAVPGALLAAPGLLLILVIVAQSLGALAWLPIVRRKIGGFGLGPRLTPPRGHA